MNQIILPIISDEEWKSGSDYISKSRCALYKFCPLKYRKQYIEKVLPYESTHATTVGTRFHEFAETFIGLYQNYPVSEWGRFIHPDFVEEEREMLNWFIEDEAFRYSCGSRPIALELRVVDHEHKLRGMIDRIDQVNDEWINVFEYKTSQKVKKPDLSFEFAFYDILLDSIKELEGFKRKHTVIYPRLQKVLEFKPSRRSTVMNRIDQINNSIKNDLFKPSCDHDYATYFCSCCTLEEIAYHHEKVRLSENIIDNKNPISDNQTGFVKNHNVYNIRCNQHD
jgi:hypothetical protein